MKIQSIIISLSMSGFLVPLAQAAQTAEEKGLELAIKGEKSLDGFQGEKSEMELILINAHGDKVTRKLVSNVKETKTDGDKSVITFQWPADVNGTRMLTWTHKTTDDDQWLYLPSIKRVKRITSSNKSGSFMGSEFAYEDLGSQEPEKYKFKWIRDEVAGGRPTWVLERIPVDERSGYSKQVVWMDQEYLQPSKIEYYDRKSELLKTATFSGYQKQKNFWRAGQIDMINHQTKKQSVLSWKKRELGVQLAETEFRSEGLEK